MLILSFNTATDVATRRCRRRRRGPWRAGLGVALLEDVDALLRDARVEPRAIDALVAGTGPGSFTSTRIGLASRARLALALDLPSPASRRWTRWPPRGWTPPRGGRSSRRGIRPGPARCPRRARAGSGDRVRRERGDPLSAALERRGRSCRPTRTTSVPSARGCAALAVRLALRRRSSPSCARPTRRHGAPRERRAVARAARPRHRRGDRARLVPAVVAVDVRRRLQAELDRDRRLPRGGARRVRVRVPVRRCLARHERRRLADLPETRVASTLSSASSRSPPPIRGGATRSRCASPTRRRFGCTSGSASRPAASGAATTRTIVRTR